MTDAELLALVPAHKHDIERANQIAAVGWPTALPVLPQLLAWLQDMNWPVAKVLEPFIAQAGLPLVSEIRRVWGGDDTIWKYWLVGLISDCAPNVQATLRPDLERFAAGNRPGDEDEAENWDRAREVLSEMP